MNLAYALGVAQNTVVVHGLAPNEADQFQAHVADLLLVSEGDYGDQFSGDGFVPLPPRVDRALEDWISVVFDLN